MENGNQNTIILLREGIFWKAYERSAYAFFMQIHPYKPTRKWVISVKQDIVSLGFPMSSADTILKDAKILLKQADSIVLSALPVIAEEVEGWKQNLPMILPDSKQVPQKSDLFVAPKSAIYEQLANNIRGFNLESKTPVECMLFLMEQKRMLGQ
ncbi:hypothetical protein [Bacteroides sp.]|uniref:hypothetical protein n=1 Tax=Bacteroides sp. TaxID=29523 RepID=UPI0026155E2F|nr:hypothetical protein [Bacteroides sp.]